MKVGLITQYPDVDAAQASTKNLSGVATFCKYQYADICDEDLELIIYANMTAEEPYERKEGANKVFFCWQKGINPFGNIYKDIKKRNIQLVHIQHELFLYGSVLANFFLLVFLLLCKISGIKTIMELHGVVPLNRVNREFAQENRINLPPALIKICFFMLYFVMSLFSNRIIVHEDIFKTYLWKHYKIKEHKVDIIPLVCIEPEVIYSKDEARARLSLPIDAKIILYLGYITGYKGLDILVDAAPEFLNQIDNSVLFLSGGLHPRLKGDPEYISYIDNLKSRALGARESAVKWHGFTPDEELPVVYAAADVVMFPYTIGMSSSGPLAQAIAYERPFLVSHAFDGIIDEHKCFFHNTPNDCSEKVCAFFADSKLRDGIMAYGLAVKKERQVDVLQKKILNIYKKVAKG